MLMKELRESEQRTLPFASQLEQLVEERTQELVESQHRLRALAMELNLAEQRERRRLAGELHDYLAQWLVLCRLKLGQIRRVGLPKTADEKVRETEEVLTQALDYSRTLIAELSPPVLQEYGLPAGLNWLGEQMRRRGLRVIVKGADAVGLSLPNDCEVLLFQSVRELLMNALKYANSTQVVVQLQQCENRLYIEVSDDGVGFDLAACAVAVNATTSKFGLLSIRERMRALGGWLDLQSTLGKGTKATLVLPIPNTNAPSSESGKNAELPIQKSIPHERDSKTRVLLVDDHAMVRQGLRSVLDSYPDIEVVGEAWDGQEAAAGTDRLRPAVVVMDINMPKMNGIEATAYIKARHPEVVVIGLSVNAGVENEMAMRNAGAAKLLTKEAAVDELHRAIQEALRATP
jgi:CheY-like chemotaxis protein